MKKKNNRSSFSPKNKGDKVNVNPKMKDLPENSGAPLASTNEAATLNSQQRVRRGVIMRRMQPRLRVAQLIARRRMASPETLKIRSEKLARRLVKKRFAGERGYGYSKLGTGEKITVDRMVGNKGKLIKAIATRVYPKVRQAEFVRANFARKGKYMKINPLKLQGLVKNKRPVDESLTPSAMKSLTEKAKKHNMSVEVLVEVYNRGIKTWSETKTKLSPAQYAFNRVNSFLQDGKAFEEDKDLLEHMVMQTRFVLVTLKNGKLALRKVTTHKNVPVGSTRKEEVEIKEYMSSSTKVINVRKKNGGIERRRVTIRKDMQEALIKRVRKSLGL